MIDLNTATVSQLTELYNALPGIKPIKKFESKAKAIARLDQVNPGWNAPPKPASANAPKRAKSSVSAAIKALILEGKTNQEVWDIVKPKFNLSDDKAYYPSWNRFDLRRKGMLT